MSPRRRTVWLWRLIAAIALALVGTLYLQPQFIMDVGLQLWRCL
ncbi:hypothetical protein [Aquabacterium fontiphilum]|jgi:hypothetical protein|nr:hypothetical protein [Aquabacterium fontiphilum]